MSKAIATAKRLKSQKSVTFGSMMMAWNHAIARIW